jgi:hypothetical protein
MHGCRYWDNPGITGAQGIVSIDPTFLPRRDRLKSGKMAGLTLRGSLNRALLFTSSLEVHWNWR